MKKAVPTLFIFNNIFFPQTVIPLTVTDDVSKKMLLTCYQNNIDIALYHPHRRSAGVATLGKIILVEHDQDGKMDAIVQGLMRIKLEAMDKDHPYPQYHTSDYFDIDEKTQTLNDSPIERLHSVLLGWLNRHVHSARERERFIKDMSSPSKLINNLCMFMIKDVELKKIFLESTSLLERIRMMNALLVGDKPETEDIEMCEAIKNFERLETDNYKNAS